MGTFKCALCGGTFDDGPEDEAMAEARSFFGPNIKKEDCAVVCDGCFQKMHPEKHPHLVEQAVQDFLKRPTG